MDDGIFVFLLLVAHQSRAQLYSHTHTHTHTHTHALTCIPTNHVISRSTMNGWMNTAGNLTTLWPLPGVGVCLE